MSLKIRPKVMVAGAGGALGSAICMALAADYEVVALVGSRLRLRDSESGRSITVRACDPFSRKEVEAACAGCDHVIYLVHTRLPTARLDQAACQDMDLLIADNFARAARQLQVRQIIYLGGIIPEGNVSDRIVESRNEVVQALGFYGTPVTALRAGLVVAPGSSAVRLLANLATRFPVVFIPAWALSRKQPIAQMDLIRAMRYCLGNEKTYGQSFDIGGPAVMSFRDMVRKAADRLRRRPVVLTVPFFPARLYRWYLRILDRKAHPALIRLVVENLRHDTVVKDNPVQRFIEKGAIPPGQALDPYLAGTEGELPSNPRDRSFKEYAAGLESRSAVRSIQRVVLPQGRNATWVAETYLRWLPRFVWPFVACEIDSTGSCRILVRVPRLHILTLTFKPDHSSPERRMYFITGGFLARSHGDPKPRLEFRDVLEGRFTIIAIHDFTPRLPWGLYSTTQAVIHLFVMRAFQRYMARLASRPS